jgi:hypothetical protein
MLTMKYIKTFIYIKIFIYIFILLYLNILSCKQESSYTITKEVIINKETIYFYNREPVHKFAFSDGSEMKVSFGLYSKFNIGDTVLIKHYIGFSIISL